MANQNPKRNFDQKTHIELKNYVYALRDPRDGKIFYIGEGQGDRIFSHFNEAEKFSNTDYLGQSSKVSRIQEIWREDLDVEWFIIRHGMEQGVAYEVEAAIIDAIEESMNGSSLNIVRGKNTSRGILMPEEIEALSAKHVRPTNDITVFIFPIQNALKSHNEINESIIYNAIRGDWRITNQYREIKHSYAVGLKSGLSVGAYKIAQWKETENLNGKCYFDANPEFSSEIKSELLKKSWLNIIAAAKGYYQRGNHLVVEFKGSQFKIVRGCPGHTWTSIDFQS